MSSIYQYHDLQECNVSLKTTIQITKHEVFIAARWAYKCTLVKL